MVSRDLVAQPGTRKRPEAVASPRRRADASGATSEFEHQAAAEAEWAASVPQPDYGAICVRNSADRDAVAELH